MSEISSNAELITHFWRLLTRSPPVGKWLGIQGTKAIYQCDDRQHTFQIMPDFNFSRRIVLPGPVLEFLMLMLPRPIAVTLQMDDGLFRECQRLDISAGDTAGHLFLRNKGLWADLSDENAGTRSCQRWQMADLLLADPSRSWSAQGLQQATGWNPGLVWKAMASLQQQGYLLRVHRGEWHLEDAERLRRAVTQLTMPAIELQSDEALVSGDQGNYLKFLESYFWEKLCPSFPTQPRGSKFSGAVWSKEAGHPVFTLDGVSSVYRLVCVPDLSVNQVDRPGDGKPVLFVTSVLKDSLLRACRRAGVSCMDLSGRAFLRGRNLWFQRPARWSVKHRTPWRDQDIFGGKSVRVALALLDEPQQAWNLPRLQQATGLSMGTIWKAMDYYHRQGWVTCPRYGQWHLHDGQLLRNALRDCQGSNQLPRDRRRARRWSDMRTYDRAGDLAAFARILLARLPEIRFARETAESLRAGQGIGERLVFYAPRFFTCEERAEWALAERRKGMGNLCVLRAQDSYLLSRGPEIDGLPVSLLP